MNHFGLFRVYLVLKDLLANQVCRSEPLASFSLSTIDVLFLTGRPGAPGYPGEKGLPGIPGKQGREGLILDQCPFRSMEFFRFNLFR